MVVLVQIRKTITTGIINRGIDRGLGLLEYSRCLLTQRGVEIHILVLPDRE